MYIPLDLCRECQSQPSRGVLMQLFDRRATMPKGDFNKVVPSFIKITIRHGCCPVKLLHSFRSHFPSNTFGGLLLECCLKCCES